MKIWLYLLKTLLFLAITNIMFLIMIITKEKNLSDKITANIDKFNENYEKRLIKLRFRNYYKTYNRKKDFMEKIDILILKSNLRKKVPLFSAEMVLFLSAVIAIVSLIISYNIIYNIFASIVIAGFSFLIIIKILKIQANKNAAKVDNMLLEYINTLINFCFIDDNIIFSIENTVPYLREPLRSFNESFVYEVKHGLSLDEAFENLKSKVDNKRFKLLIKSLQLCSKHNGSYIEVLRKSKEVMKDYFIKKSDRKRQINEKRMGVYAVMIVAGTLIFATYKVNPSLKALLRHDLVGQLLVTYLIFIFLYALYKTLTLQKFDY